MTPSEFTWTSTRAFFSTAVFALSLFINNAMALESKHLCNPSLTTILTVDGGGVAGVIPAVFLNELEQDADEKTNKMFDFMAGVSTGSLIVSLLATPDEKGLSKYSPEQVISLYKNKASEVFSASKLHKLTTLGGLIGPKFESTGMQNLTNQYYANTTVSQLLSNVAIFSYDLHKKGMVLFTNWKNTGPDTSHYKVKDIIQGSTAIMSYFSPKWILDNQGNEEYILADAALVFNNPSAMAFLFAYNRCPNSKHYVVVSLATGRDPGINIRPKTWGIIQWAKEMIQATLQGETTAGTVIMTNIVKVLNANIQPNKIPRVIFVRLNPDITLDQTNPIDASPEHIAVLESVGKKYLQKNQARINCLVKLLKNHSVNNLDKDCLQLLENKTGAQLFIDLI